MLCREGVLWTWRLVRWPRLGQGLAAERLPDHRVDYLDYEGPVSQNRGNVRRLLGGTVEIDQTLPGKIVLRNAPGQPIWEWQLEQDSQGWKFLRKR